MDSRGELKTADCFCAQPPLMGRLLSGPSSRANGTYSYFRECCSSNERHFVEDRSVHEVTDGELHKKVGQHHRNWAARLRVYLVRQ